MPLARSARSERLQTSVADAGLPADQGELNVLYDADCGFCRWSVAQLLKLDRGDSLHPVAIQSARGQALLAPVPEDIRLESAHAVTAAGEVFSGGDAAPLIAARLRGRSVALPLASASPWLTRRVYDLVAANRAGISRFVPAGSRAKADALLAQRVQSR